MPTEAQHSETMSGEPSSSAPVVPHADVSADTAVILAALGRIDAAVRSERDVLERLREQLGEMAQAVARAKAVADSENSAAMLDEFEHRVDAMIELAGGRVVHETPRAQAESDQVPTVSGVVLRLGPAEAASGFDAALPAEGADDSAPSQASVAKLTAMVEALSASIQTPAQELETHVPETQDVTAVQAVEQTEEPAAAELPAPTIEAAVETNARADNNTLHETALLASFEQMGSRPIPPPDEGTAVIFTSRTAPAEEPVLVAEATTEFATVSPPPAEAPAVLPPEQAAVPVLADTPAPEATRLPEADFDPTDFLFGPEPEPDPAAFLLDPAPPRQPKPVVLPQPEFVSAPAEPAPAETPPAEAPTQELPAEVVQPAPPEPATHDPLRALKAMSENEKIAIFS